MQGQGGERHVGHRRNGLVWKAMAFLPVSPTLQAVSQPAALLLPFPLRWGCQPQEGEPRAGLAPQGAQLAWQVVLGGRWPTFSSADRGCSLALSLTLVLVLFRQNLFVVLNPSNTISAANHSPTITTILTQCANKAIIQVLFCLTRMLGLWTFA